MHDYKRLKIWQKAIELVSDIYKVTCLFPKGEQFNLISQINRAAVSIPSNIAEGAGRNSNKEFIQYLSIAHASTYEVETQLIISRNLGYLEQEDLSGILCNLYEVQKMNYALQKKLRQSV
ncbi:four helix bundle protein [Sphingobacterium sp. DK4209]|uniref:Four helix bundle protein n=1 Tax=Sphingobacterium zhuxiongii TaxID=2662364 RepID=A0A5Q0QEJ0_9SPHI|nr:MULTISPECIES: four helix bundle protein [unclassified Sphingobacterium]MVZ65569.1 four helix bundle protein [Sphingobacterium sp. DK4209]QGA27694.1 four helix bundle protein [Sphingobacterium sp. dk4302]